LVQRIKCHEEWANGLRRSEECCGRVNELWFRGLREEAGGDEEPVSSQHIPQKTKQGGKRKRRRRKKEEEEEEEEEEEKQEQAQKERKELMPELSAEKKTKKTQKEKKKKKETQKKSGNRPTKGPSTPTLHSAVSASAENAEHKCSICLDPPVQPISLPCTHTFCQECLQKDRAHTTAEKIATRRGVRVSCPNCRAVTTMENANGVVSNSPPARAQLTRSERCKGGVCSSTKRCSHKKQRVEEEGGGEEEEQEEEQQQEEQEEDKRGDGAVFRPGVRVCALWEGEWLKAYYRRLEEEGLHAVSEVVHGCSTWSVLDVELEMGWGSVPSWA
jgi:hypothetical protein